MALFPDAWMGELLSKNDIVSVVSEYVQLTSKGRSSWACCPFHSEKTASFHVVPDRQMYHCFGCNAGGGVINFIMEIERLTFVDAVKFLAHRVGMELPDEVDDAGLQRERALKERVYAACKDAALYYHHQLLAPEGAGARKYLLSRGLDATTIKRFGLGFAPDAWHALLDHLCARGYTLDELVAAGLALRRTHEGGYDVFRNRVIFPIIATTGRVIGFGARTMGSDPAKYINTGETPVFNKRNNLYALNMQRGKKLPDLIIVEGYLDAISLYQYGVQNAVASLGTALTTQQARLIKRYVDKVYISYDGDSAGQNATLRGLDILEKEGLAIKVLVIPGGMDPDDYVRAKGADAYLALKDAAFTLNEFKIEHMASMQDLSTEDGREAFAKQACALVGGLQPVEQERYYSLIARKTGLPVEALKAQGDRNKVLEKNSFQKSRNNRDEQPETIVPERRKIEELLLSCMAADPKAAVYAKRAEENGEAIFLSPELKRFAQEILDAYAVEVTRIDISRLLLGLSGPDAEAVARAMVTNDVLSDPQKQAEDCIKRIMSMNLDDELKTVSAQHNKDLPPEEKKRLESRIAELMNRLKRLK